MIAHEAVKELQKNREQVRARNEIGQSILQKRKIKM